MAPTNAFRLARLSDDILSVGGYPLLIRLPASKLLGRLFLFFSVGTLLLALSFTLLAMVTIPVLLYWSYLYYLYCHIWKRFGLSRVYTVAAPLLAVVTAAGLRYVLYIL